HIQYGARTSKKLARGLFHAMMRFGPKLEREQLLLSRFCGIATELFVISASCSFAQHKIDSGEPVAEVLSLAEYACRSAKLRIDHHFAGTAENVDKRAYDLTQELMDGKHDSLRAGIV
ncbi:MAG: DNA polymerase II, partial [Verrucomicrobiota bacterium]|nr:DNA polymerase II [Verrucomicrobiota bacterium]